MGLGYAILWVRGASTVDKGGELGVRDASSPADFKSSLNHVQGLHQSSLSRAWERYYDTYMTQPTLYSMGEG